MGSTWDRAGGIEDKAFGKSHGRCSRSLMVFVALPPFTLVFNFSKGKWKTRWGSKSKQP